MDGGMESLLCNILHSLPDASQFVTEKVMVSA